MISGLPITLLTPILGLLFAPNAAVTAFAATAQDIATAVGSGDVVTALSDIVNAPIVITGAFLNGFPSDDLPVPLPSEGALLTNPDSAINPQFFGTFLNILDARDGIAGLITPFTPTDPVSLSSSDPLAVGALSLGNLPTDLTALLSGSDLSQLLDFGGLSDFSQLVPNLLSIF